MKTHRLLLLLFITPMLVACGNSLQMTYKSDPEAATLYQGGTNHGRTPVVVDYTITPEEAKQGYKVIDGVSARWVSGAKAEAPAIKIILSDKAMFGQEHEHTFVRPAQIPGQNIDAEFAAEMIKAREALEVAKSEADSAKKMAEAVEKSAGDARRHRLMHGSHMPYTYY